MKVEDLHLTIVHLQQLVTLVIFHIHNIVDRFYTSFLASLDDLDCPISVLGESLSKGCAYVGLKVRDLLQRRVSLPHSLYTHLRQVHGAQSIQPSVRGHDINTCG